MKRSIKSKKKTRRTLYAWEPSTPIILMLKAHTTGKSHGARSRAIEEALANYLGPKYPKLMDRYQQMKKMLSAIQDEHSSKQVETATQ